MLFFFNDTATTEIYTLSLHDALPISPPGRLHPTSARRPRRAPRRGAPGRGTAWGDRPEVSQPQEPNFQTRSEEHTSELQSQSNLVCRLLLEKKKMKTRQC